MKQILKEAREAKKMSQKELAKAVGTTQQVIAGYENGKKMMADKLVMISEVLDIDMNEFKAEYRIEMEDTNGRNVVLDKLTYTEARADFEGYKKDYWNKDSEPGDIILMTRDGEVVDKYTYEFSVKYAVIDQRKNLTGDVHLALFDTVEDAKEEAEDQWNHLTRRERGQREIIVARIIKQDLSEEDDWESFHSYDDIIVFR